LRTLSSIFELAVDNSIPVGEYQIVTQNDDKIQIIMAQETKQAVDVARNSRNNNVILMNSVYFVAAIHAIAELREIMSSNSSELN